MWIQGYADPRGDIVYNLVLSYRRAQWVKEQLVKRGVDESRIEYATGWGKLYQTCAAGGRSVLPAEPSGRCGVAGIDDVSRRQ